MTSREKTSARGWVIPLLAAIVFGSAAFFVSCYPGEELTISDLDIVATFFAPGADFSTKQTYTMPTFIFDLNDSSMQSDAAAQEVLDVIDENMQELGYTVADTASADVRMVAFKTSSTWVGGSCYPSYYPYYWGWCYPVTYSYETGTFLIVMLDNSDRTTEAVALWVAGLNGTLEGSTTASLTNRLHDGIHQAFEQSPYLGDGK